MKEGFVSFIINKILPRVTYNEEFDRYELKYNDYQEFKLSVGQKKILKEICKNNGIFLECRGYLRQPLVAVEDENLFKEYNDIKFKIIATENRNEKTRLENIRIQIRNKIVCDNISFIDSIINRRITDINNKKNKDDIYQLGYEILVKYIDNNYLVKGKFKDHISSILIFAINNKLVVTGDSFDSEIEKYLEIIRSKKEENLSYNELAEIMNLDLEKVRELVTLDNMLFALNIDDEVEKLNNNDYNKDSVLYDDGFEDRMIDEISIKNIVLGVMMTLSDEDRELLNLYYGISGKEYSMLEIANMYGVTKSRISSGIINVLEKIRKSIRMKYLYELYDIDKQVNDNDNYQNKRLEEFLVRYINKELYELVCKELNYKYKAFFQLYYLDKELSLKEIANKLDISLSYASNLKIIVTNEIRNIIINTIKKDNGDKMIYSEYLDYLMKLHLKQYRTRGRSR